MALFKKEVCAHCGKESGMLDRVKLADKKFICWDCRSKCSDVFADNFLSHHTYEEYCAYLQHKEENYKKLEQFEMTDLYFDRIAVDMNKGWFVFYEKHPFETTEELLASNIEVFEAKDLVFYDFFYIIKDVKEGILNNKVKADVELSIAFNNKWYPYAFKGKVLKNYKHKANITGFFERKATITDNEKKSDLELYLLSIMIDNGINIPVSLGGKLTTNVDLDPYVPYLTKLFELKKLNFFDINEFSDRLNFIAPGMFVKQQIKKRFG